MTDFEKFDYIIIEIERGLSLRKSLSGLSMSSKTFYEMLDSDELLRKRYARACEERADAIFDEIIEIADISNADVIFTEDGKMSIDGEAIQRSRLKIDARKWSLSKMNPKKYGDKVDLTSDGEKISVPILSFDPFNYDEADNSTT